MNFSKILLKMGQHRQQASLQGHHCGGAGTCGLHLGDRLRSRRPTPRQPSTGLRLTRGETHQHDGPESPTARWENPRYLFAAHPFGVCDPRFKTEAAP